MDVRFVTLIFVLVVFASILLFLIRTRGSALTRQTRLHASYVVAALAAILIILATLWNFSYVSSPEAWTQIISAVVAVGAIITVAIQISLDGFRNGVDLLLQLQGDYDKPEMRQVRQSAVKNLTELSAQPNPNGGSEPSIDVIIVLNFFQTMALLVNSGALKLDMVWDRFYSRIYCYYSLSSHYIDKRQEQDSTLWRELEDLYEKLMRFHSRQIRRNGGEPVSEEEARQAVFRSFYELEEYVPKNSGETN
jgi:hypothetical protein